MILISLLTIRTFKMCNNQSKQAVPSKISTNLRICPCSRRRFSRIARTFPNCQTSFMACTRMTQSLSTHTTLMQAAIVCTRCVCGGRYPRSTRMTKKIITSRSRRTKVVTSAIDPSVSMMRKSLGQMMSKPYPSPMNLGSQNKRLASI